MQNSIKMVFIHSTLLSGETCPAPAAQIKVPQFTRKSNKKKRTKRRSRRRIFSR